MSTFENDATFHPNGSTMLTELADGTGVLLNMQTKFYYTLNRTAVCVWKHLDSHPGCGVDDLASAVSASFEVSWELARTDVAGLLGYLPARQDDTDLIRTWEVAGAAHVDRFLLGEMADASGCEPPVNDGPQQHLVGMAALRSLLTWIDDGTVPPTSPRLVVDDAGAYERDDDGIVLGGIRTPVVDVPVDVLSGESAPGASVFCLLAGGTTPLTADQLAARYDSAEDYEQQFEASTDEAIDAGFVLADDRDTLLDAAQPDRIAS